MMQSSAFAVGDEPYIVWENSVQECCLEFLEGLDSDYFTYLLRTHVDSDDEQRSAVAVRQALHHATETAFSFLGAFVQAPDCPYAWISRCSNAELRAVVRRISEGDPTLLRKIKLKEMGWEAISEVIFSRFEPGTERQKKAIEGFSKLWKRLAGDFLSEANIEEYNATKHGFRTKSGGFKLKIGPTGSNGEPPPDSEMTLLGESNIGAMFFKLERLVKNGGRHLLTKRIATNWSFERDALLLQLVQLSIQNTISALKIANNVKASVCKFSWPSDEGEYTRPWEHSPGVMDITISSTVNPDRLPTISRKVLLEQLRKALNGEA